MGQYHSRGYGLCHVAKTRFVDNDPWVTFGEATHQNEDTEIHMRMYWQLFIYYHLCKDNKNFWPEVFAKMRKKYAGVYTESNPGKSQMMFVEAVCETAKEDLTDFFDFWGFFTPVDDLKIEQYGTFTYTVTEKRLPSSISKTGRKSGSNRVLTNIVIRNPVMSVIIRSSREQAPHSITMR